MGFAEGFSVGALDGDVGAIVGAIEDVGAIVGAIEKSSVNSSSSFGLGTSGQSGIKQCCRCFNLALKLDGVHAPL